MKLSDILNGNIVSAETGGSDASYLAYVRVSTEDQERAGSSIPAQIREIHQYAEARGIRIAESYQEAESAFSDESRRPEFWRMVERAKSDPKITGILVHDYSRFFRDPYAGPTVKGQLLAHGVKVVSVTEPEYDPRTIAGLAIEKMTEFKNASYSIDVSFHTRKGMRENIQRRDPEVGYCYKNGGVPPWGFKAYKVQRGTDKRGLPILKTLWEKDDTVIAGKPMWEWARYVLIELRLNQHASLDRIRDFLNEKGIPAPRKTHWGTSSLHALLQPHSLLQFAGYGVWNVRGKKVRHRSPSEWQVVENAHPAILSMDEAEAIMEINKQQSQVGTDKSKGRMANVRADNSRYLLTGGLFVCGRCGANMVGYRSRGRLYYVCGSKLYRKGLGCGEALHVRKEEIEAAVVKEVGNLFESWSDSNVLIRMLNQEVESRYRQRTAATEEIDRELARIDHEMANIRNAIRSGLDDVEWANGELSRLKAEREQVTVRRALLEEEHIVPQIGPEQIVEYQKRFADIMVRGTNKQKRDVVRMLVKGIEVNPEIGDIMISVYSRPPVSYAPKKQKGTPEESGVPIGLGAGRGFEPLTFGL